MTNTIKRISIAIASTAAILAGVPEANAAYHPNRGDLYYNGAYYLDSYFLWSAAGPWSVTRPGYEHDLHVHDRNFFTQTCTSGTNLPEGYDDCPTAGFMDPNGPVFSFGSFNARAVASNTWYFGAWQFSSHGTANTSPFTLQGQENENRCGGVNSIWCMYSTQTKTLLSGWYMNWGGNPTVLNWSV